MHCIPLHWEGGLTAIIRTKSEWDSLSRSIPPRKQGVWNNYPHLFISSSLKWGLFVKHVWLHSALKPSKSIHCQGFICSSSAWQGKPYMIWLRPIWEGLSPTSCSCEWFALAKLITSLTQTCFLCPPTASLVGLLWYSDYSGLRHRETRVMVLSVFACVHVLSQPD